MTKKNSARLLKALEKLNAAETAFELMKYALRDALVELDKCEIPLPCPCDEMASKWKGPGEWRCIDLREQVAMLDESIPWAATAVQYFSAKQWLTDALKTKQPQE